LPRDCNIGMLQCSHEDSRMINLESHSDREVHSCGCPDTNTWMRMRRWEGFAVWGIFYLAKELSKGGRRFFGGRDCPSRTRLDKKCSLRALIDGTGCFLVTRYVQSATFKCKCCDYGISPKENRTISISKTIIIVQVPHNTSWPKNYGNKNMCKCTTILLGRKITGTKQVLYPTEKYV